MMMMIELVFYWQLLSSDRSFELLAALDWRSKSEMRDESKDMFNQKVTSTTIDPSIHVSRMTEWFKSAGKLKTHPANQTQQPPAGFEFWPCMEIFKTKSCSTCYIYRPNLCMHVDCRFAPLRRRRQTSIPPRIEE